MYIKSVKLEIKGFFFEKITHLHYALKLIFT